jgi:hypothetical protein
LVRAIPKNGSPLTVKTAKTLSSVGGTFPTIFGTAHRFIDMITHFQFPFDLRCGD